MRVVTMKALSSGALVLILSFAGPSSNAQVATSDADVRDRYQAAVSLMGTREYERAVEALQAIVVAYPDFPEAYRSLERAYVILDDVDSAATFFSERVTATPDNAIAHHALGRVVDPDDESIEHMKRAIALDPLFARAYRDLAYFARKNGKLELAVAFFEERLEDSEVGARAYYGLGYLYSYEHEADKALEALERAIELDEELTLALSEIVAVYGQTGFYAEVISASTRLLEISERLDERDGVGYAHLALGNGHLYLGNYWRALHHLNESLELAQQAGEKGREGAALTAIGNVYVTLGEPERALEFHRASYELGKASQDPQAEVIALNNVGHDLAEAGRAEDSFEYYDEALEIARSNDYRYDESILLLNMASAHEYLGDRDRAVEEYLAALVLARELDIKSSEGAILRDLANIEIERKRFADAAKYFNETLAVAEETGDMEFRWAAMGGLARVFEQRGETERAIAHYADALALYHQARTAGIESMGSGFLEHYPNIYPPFIRLLARTGRIEEAFDYTQEYKAASLVRVISEGRNLADDLLPESYRVRLAELRGSLEDAHAALSAARAKVEPERGAIERLEREVSALELSRASLLEEIRREEQGYFQLTASEPVTLPSIRARILPSEGAMIDYVVGEETLSAFVLTRDELVYHELPVAAEELAAMLEALSPVFDRDKDVDDASRAIVFGPQVADFSIPPARALYDALIEPLEPGLAEASELVIVPDGLLHYLPFEMLVADAESVQHAVDFENATFLLERYAVSYAASASLLDPSLQRPRSAERGLLAFGNPDFTRDESERLPEAFYASALSYSGGVVRDGQLLPLPAAESEVAAIQETIGLESRVYVGRDATEAVFREEAEDYSILHFATHFLNDDRQPLYSKIVLSRGDDAEQDGYLQTYEIFNTRLNADLVVLSACSTGLGKLSQGEGLAGVSRAFLYAGVPSLVVSLWSVDDAATATIMAAFYRRLAEGRTKHDALRRAKLDYLRDASGGKRDPFYWAPFILIGDSTPVELGPPRWYRRAATLGFAAVAALALLWLARMRFPSARSQSE